MQLLIIGARGMLGSMLAQVFADYQPTLWDRDHIDITSAGQVRDKIRDLDPQVIINAAAYTNVDGAESDKETAFAVNATGIRNLANIAQELDATLVHYSTDYVFPGDAEDGYAEDDPPGPAVNVYGESKLAGERALVEIKPRFYLQRIAWLYGPAFVNPMDGKPSANNFVDKMLELAKDHQQLTVVNDQYGCPTFTKDVALATRALLDERYPFGIYHTVNAGVASWYDFANKIFQIKHAKVDVKPTTSAEFARPARRPQYSILLNKKGPPMRPWVKALEEYLLG